MPRPSGLLAPLAPAEPPLQPLDLDRGTSGLALALRKVGVSSRVLYVTAHPDDEMNGVLVRLSRGLGVRTALLTVTRGEGGRERDGPERYDALGVLRTGELMAIHRHDGAEQYFGRAYEFGFSFSVEETLAKWGREEETLGDIVRVVRSFRPDVILTLPLEGEGGGQHHQAVGRLAREAFRAAADPSRFPGQLQEGLRPWQARKLYQGGVGGYGKVPGTPVHVPTGVYDPILGMTWQQLGSRARGLHRCQGVGQIVADAGPAAGTFSLLDATPPVAGPEGDVLDGIDGSIAGLARFAPGIAPVLLALQAQATRARAALDPASPEASVPALAEMLTAIRELAGSLDGRIADRVARAEVAERLREEEEDVERALGLAQGLVLEARADDGLATPGQSVGVAVALFNNAGRGLEVEALELEAPAGWPIDRPEGESGPLAGAGAHHARFAVTTLPTPAPRNRTGAGRRTGTATSCSFPPTRRARGARRPGRPRAVPDRRRPGDAAHPGRLALRRARGRRRAPPRAAGRARALPAPLAGRRGGAPRLPARAGRDPRVRAEPRPRRRRGGRPARGAAGVVRRAVVRLPALLVRGRRGGRALPGGAACRSRLPAPSPCAPWRSVTAASTARRSRPWSYDHVERRQLLRPAEARVLVLDVRTAPGASVGYVMGSGDAGAEAIRQLGVPLTLLTAEDLLFGDLSRFTTIVTGIRAYETRPDLRSSHGRLLRWVEAGGHLVVQYNRDAFNRLAPEAPPLPAGAPSPYAPFPAAVTSERTSDETAPLRLLVPDHPLLTTPNRIGPATGRAGCRSAGSSSWPRATRATWRSSPRPTPSRTTRARSEGCSSKRVSGRERGPTSAWPSSGRSRPASPAAGASSPTSSAVRGARARTDHPVVEKGLHRRGPLSPETGRAAGRGVSVDMVSSIHRHEPCAPRNRPVADDRTWHLSCPGLVWRHGPRFSRRAVRAARRGLRHDVHEEVAVSRAVGSFRVVILAVLVATAWPALAAAGVLQLTKNDVAETSTDAALDVAGNVHVVYERGGTIYYRGKTSSGWSAEEAVATGTNPAVGAGASGVPQVVFLSGGGLWFTARIGAPWMAPVQFGVGSSVDMAVDGNDVAHVVYPGQHRHQRGQRRLHGPQLHEQRGWHVPGEPDQDLVQLVLLRRLGSCRELLLRLRSDHRGRRRRELRDHLLLPLDQRRRRL